MSDDARQLLKNVHKLDFMIDAVTVFKINCTHKEFYILGIFQEYSLYCTRRLFQGFFRNFDKYHSNNF